MALFRCGFVLSVLLMSSTATAQLKAGFRDLRFGDSPRATMTLVEQHKGGVEAKTYRVRDEDLKVLPGIAATEIRYDFLRGRFCRVRVEFAGSGASYYDIYQKLFEAWGSPQGGFSIGFSSWWKGTGDDKVVAVLDGRTLTIRSEYLDVAWYQYLKEEEKKQKPNL